MEKKALKWQWIVGAIALIALFSLPAKGNLLLMLAMPFVWAGKILRTMSLSGAVGNAFALVLYGLLCLSPLLLIRKKDRNLENALLLLASVLLFRVMWLMVNPGQMPVVLRSELGSAIYAGAVYSVFITWGVLRLMRGTDGFILWNVYHALRVFLLICAAQFVLEGFVLGFAELLGQLEMLRESNTALTAAQLMPSFLFLTLEYVSGAVERGLVAWVLYLGAKLLTELETDPYSEACQQKSEEIFRWCRNAMILVTAMSCGINLAQVLMASWLVKLDFTLRIPAVSLGITFGMMALTRLLAQGKALKDDNDLFV